MRPRGALRGRTVVVTRPREQARALSRLLRDAGAFVIEIPAIRICPAEDQGAFGRARLRLGEYRWAVFTSQNAVAAFLARRDAPGVEEQLRAMRLAAIGPATAAALRRHGLEPAVTAEPYVAEALVAALAAEPSIRGARVLLPRAADARDVLPEGLRALGAEVDVVPMYRVEVERDQQPEVWTRLSQSRVDAVTFTSPSTVRGFVELLGPDRLRMLAGALVACIGPVTAGAARDAGLDVSVVARRYTTTGLLEALAARLGPAASRAG